MISEFLFFEEHATKIEHQEYVNLKIEIRELIKEDFNRKVLTGILLDLQKDVSGITKKRVFKLYYELGLQEDAYAKLNSWRWEVVSQGILELTQMQVTEAYGFITKFINDKRGIIRKQAEIATVTLKHEGINYFLDTTNYKISEWQQLKLLDVIRNLESFQPPKFKAWLTSNNKYVVLFALRLIKYYKQNDAYSSIIELVKHSNDQIKAEAIGCIREFNILDARDTLKLVFYKCSTDNKILILDTLAIFGQKEDISFLQIIQNKETNFSVKSKALSAINTIYPESIMPTEGIENILNYQIPEAIFTNPEEITGQNVPSENKSLADESPAGTDECIEVLLNFNLNASQTIEDHTTLEREEIEFKLEVDLDGTEALADSLNRLPVAYEEVLFKTPFLFSDEVAPTDSINSETENKVHGNLSGLTSIDGTLDTIFNIPSPCFIHDPSITASIEEFIDKQLSIVELLEAIDEFGDKREIPLLEELRDNEEMEAFKTQILGLIERFSNKNTSLGKLTNENSSELYSVFEEFFRKYDTDSKLLLLEEIPFVGDEKELYFLSKLIYDPDLGIRECAKRVHQELKKRLDLEKDDKGATKEAEFNLKDFDESGSKTSSSIYEVDIAIGNEIDTAIKQSPKKPSDLIPLEFCFLLNELEIKLPRDNSILEVDFKLETDIYKVQTRDLELNTALEVVISTNENYSPDSLSSNSGKIKSKRNG